MERKKAHIHFNPVLLELGRKNISIKTWINEESVVVTTEDIVICPSMAISCHFRLSHIGELHNGYFK